MKVVCISVSEKQSKYLTLGKQYKVIRLFDDWYELRDDTDVVVLYKKELFSEVEEKELVDKNLTQDLYLELAFDVHKDLIENPVPVEFLEDLDCLWRAIQHWLFKNGDTIIERNYIWPEHWYTKLIHFYNYYPGNVYKYIIGTISTKPAMIELWKDLKVTRAMFYYMQFIESEFYRKLENGELPNNQKLLPKTTSTQVGDK